MLSHFRQKLAVRQTERKTGGFRIPTVWQPELRPALPRSLPVRALSAGPSPGSLGGASRAKRRSTRCFRLRSYSPLDGRGRAWERGRRPFLAFSPGVCVRRVEPLTKFGGATVFPDRRTTRDRRAARGKTHALRFHGGLLPLCPMRLSIRANIDEVETEVVEIEAKLDKLVKLCSGMIEAGKAYISANKLFVSGIRDLSQQCKKEEMISECLEKCGESLQEIVNYHMILFDQAQRSVKQQLHNFVKEDVRKFKETKKQFDKVREDMEIAQVKNAQAPRNKPHEVEEATGTLSITRKCFRHLALDYVLQINVLQAKKKFEILDAMLSFMHAQYTLFQQGYNLLEEIDPYMKKLAAELDQLVIDSAMEKRDMEHKHATIQQR
ncbi:hypothetical protein ANANG_G00220260, partial [Anguilla anguilla]